MGRHNLYKAVVEGEVSMAVVTKSAEQSRRPTERERFILDMVEQSIREFSLGAMTAYQADLNLAADKGDSWEPQHEQTRKYSDALKYALHDETTLVTAIKTGKVTPDLLDRLEELYCSSASVSTTAEAINKSLEHDRDAHGTLLSQAQGAEPGASGNPNIDVAGPGGMLKFTEAEPITKDQKRRLDNVSAGLAGLGDWKSKKEAIRERELARVQELARAQAKAQADTDGSEPEEASLPVEAHHASLQPKVTLREFEGMWTAGHARYNQDVRKPGEFGRLLGTVDRGGAETYLVGFIYGCDCPINPAKVVKAGIRGHDTLVLAEVKLSNLKYLAEGILGNIRTMCIFSLSHVMEAFNGSGVRDMDSRIGHVPAIGSHGEVYRLQNRGKLKLGEPVTLSLGYLDSNGNATGEYQGIDVSLNQVLNSHEFKSLSRALELWLTELNRVGPESLGKVLVDEVHEAKK